MNNADRDRTLLQQLATRVRAFRPEQVTPQATALSRTAIIDTLGVALGGSAEPCASILLRTPGVAPASGPCTVFGTDRKTSALDAALVNGTASHALDYDDFSQPMGGHQSVPLVAPLVAVAEERQLSGAALITSYVVGIETEIRLARAVNFHHYDKGWHPTATIGVFGTAAAGFDANPAALEHKQGFLNAFNGPGHYDPALLFDRWADPLEVTSPTMGLKQFPCCGSTHPAVSMMLALRREECSTLWRGRCWTARSASSTSRVTRTATLPCATSWRARRRGRIRTCRTMPPTSSPPRCASLSVMAGPYRAVWTA